MLMLLTAASSTRIVDHLDMEITEMVQTNSSEEPPKYGEKCGCRSTIYYKQPEGCCEKGLVCELETGTCKLALNSPCAPKKKGLKSLFSRKQKCAGQNTYVGRGLTCKWIPDIQDSICCIKSGFKPVHPNAGCCKGTDMTVTRLNAKNDWNLLDSGGDPKLITFTCG